MVEMGKGQCRWNGSCTTYWINTINETILWLHLSDAFSRASVGCPGHPHLWLEHDQSCFFTFRQLTLSFYRPWDFTVLSSAGIFDPNQSLGYCSMWWPLEMGTETNPRRMETSYTEYNMPVPSKATKSVLSSLKELRLVRTKPQAIYEK